MKFENLIWVAIFLVYVLSVIIKRVRAASSAGEEESAGKRPGWRERFDMLANQIQKMAGEAEQPAEMIPGNREMSWDRIDPGLENSEKPEKSEKSQETKKASAPGAAAAIAHPVLPGGRAASVKPGSARERAATGRIDSVPVTPAPDRPKPSAAVKKLPHRQLPLGIPDLRRAIIWSEILAPPLALRDK